MFIALVYIESHDRTFRIRTSRNLSDLKAKLATPWANTNINVSIDLTCYSDILTKSFINISVLSQVKSKPFV